MSQTLQAPESGYRYGTHQDVTILDCANCGITFGITSSFEQRRREDHKGFYCPNGHSNVYKGESETEKLRRRLDFARDNAARIAAERDQAKQDAKVQKGRATRFLNDRDRERKRAAAGVCPCCNRTFKQLARHMASQHPEHGRGA